MFFNLLSFLNLLSGECKTIQSQKNIDKNKNCIKIIISTSKIAPPQYLRYKNIIELNFECENCRENKVRNVKVTKTLKKMTIKTC
ncbi:MAG: hypothetical protein RL757_1600 [Bacteroidota bacterium]|jgi:hypothetical protein